MTTPSLRADPTRLELHENGAAVIVPLAARQVEALQEGGVLTATPTTQPGVWSLAAARHVGVARIGGIELRIRPKVPIRRLLFLLGYAYDVGAWRSGTVHVADDAELLPAIATAFARASERAVEQGPLQGYREIEESAPVLRGRIRTGDQLRRRFGLPLPLEIRYDDYTVDISENRILRTAAERLLRLPRVPGPTRQALLRLLRLLIDVTPLPRGTAIPAWQPSRLNARYQPALRLAELVLQGGSIDAEHGRVVVDGFLLDMAVVFEQFLTVALRDTLTPYGGRLVGQAPYHLDEDRAILLRPDIVWHARADGPPTAVVDAKYKAAKPSGYPNADVYQMLAYCARLGLPEGHLVYAKGESAPGRHRVIGAPVTIVRHALDLSADVPELLSQIRELAAAVAGVPRRS